MEMTPLLINAAWIAGAVLANLITMTPGTLSLDVSPDRKTLYVHAMYINDPEALRCDIKENLERRARALLP